MRVVFEKMTERIEKRVWIAVSDEKGTASESDVMLGDKFLPFVMTSDFCDLEYRMPEEEKKEALRERDFLLSSCLGLEASFDTTTSCLEGRVVEVKRAQVLYIPMPYGLPPNEIKKDVIVIDPMAFSGPWEVFKSLNVSDVWWAPYWGAQKRGVKFKIYSTLGEFEVEHEYIKARVLNGLDF